MSRKRRFAAAVSLAAVASMLAAMPFGAGAESFTYEPVQGADFSFNRVCEAALDVGYIRRRGYFRGGRGGCLRWVLEDKAKALPLSRTILI